MSKYIEVDKIHSDLVYAVCHPCDYRVGEHCRYGACKGTRGIVQYTEKTLTLKSSIVMNVDIRMTAIMRVTDGAKYRNGVSEITSFVPMVN